MRTPIFALAAVASLAAASAAAADDLADADAAYRAGILERAETLYARLAEKGSTVARVHRNLAVLYDASRRGGAYTDLAENHYRRALALDVNDAETHYRFGLHLHADGKGRDAIESFRSAARLDPKQADARYWLARLLASYNEAGAKECESLYRAAIAIDPGHVDAHFFLGRLLGNTGRKNDALAVLKRGEQLAPRPGHKSPSDFASEIENLN